MCIGLVVTREGMPLGYEVFAGNRTDVTTVEDVVTAMEQRYGRARRVWVMRCPGQDLMSVSGREGVTRLILCR